MLRCGFSTLQAYCDRPGIDPSAGATLKRRQVCLWQQLFLARDRCAEHGGPGAYARWPDCRRKLCSCIYVRPPAGMPELGRQHGRAWKGPSGCCLSCFPVILVLSLGRIQLSTALWDTYLEMPRPQDAKEAEPSTFTYLFLPMADFVLCSIVFDASAGGPEGCEHT